MKILFISLFLPRKPASHAGSRYVFETLSRLSARHEIHLATRLETSERPFLKPLEEFCSKIYPYEYHPVERGKRTIFDKAYLIMNYFRFSAFANGLIRNGQYDLVQVEWVESAIMIRKAGVPMVLDAHDVITKPARRMVEMATGFQKIYMAIRARLIERLELFCMKKFQTIFTVSEYDKKYLKNMQPDLEVESVNIPAGMDISDQKYKVKKNTLLFLASFKYRQKNVEAAVFFYDKVFPLVRESVPDAHFIIAGYGPPENLLALARKDSQVSVPGFVDDLDRCYKEADVFVAPILSGGGVIVKILDAMAAGTPVVTTSFGHEGIACSKGTDMLVAENEKDFAEHIVKLLHNREYREDIGMNGQNFIKSKFSVAGMTKKFEQVYQRLTAQKNI